MYANYQLRGDDDMAMEFLTIVLKRVDSSNLLAMHMTVSYRRGDITPLGWAHVRNALLFHHSWDPNKRPSTHVWPEHCVFVPPSVRFELTKRAMQQAEEKASEISGLLPGDDQKLAEVLIDRAVLMYSPSRPPSEELEGNIAREILACVPSRVAEVLMRNFHEVESLHDFRGWLWQQYWAVMNRADIPKPN